MATCGGLTPEAPVRLDGALGTELLARGLPLGAAPERWLIKHPWAIARLHEAYVEAGAQAVHTCTFGANDARLDAVGLAGRTGELARAAVGLARGAGPRWVLGDMGPTGLPAPPDSGAVPAAPRAAPGGAGGQDGSWRRQLFRAHWGLARALVDEGVDALHLETMTSLTEARAGLDAALEACEAAGREVPVWVSLTCRRDDAGGAFVTLAGEPAVQALAALRRAGAQVVGANCLLQAPALVSLARQAAAAGVGPLVLQPAAGQPREVRPAGSGAGGSPQGGGDGAGAAGASRRFVYDGDPEVFAAALAGATRGGAPLACAVGGCCGTSPAWIRRLADRLDGAA